MKCDELKPLVKPLVFSLNDMAYVDERAVEKNFENPHDHAVYKATEVDALIAKKDKEIAELKHQVWEADERAIDAGATSHEKMQESEAKDKEIRRLKNEIESLKASHYAESVDAGMRERRLRRALWLARAELARTSAWVFWNRKDDYNYNKWKKVEFKCRAKAESYL